MIMSMACHMAPWHHDLEVLYVHGVPESRVRLGEPLCRSECVYTVCHTRVPTGGESRERREGANRRTTRPVGTVSPVDGTRT